MTPPAQALREAPAYPRPRPRPAPPRRKSGPTPRPRRPASRTITPALRARGTRALDRLLRGRGWVMLIGALLAGIVFLNVSVLELNRGIASTTASARQLEAQNSVLRSRLAEVASAEAIQRAAEARGFVLPEPGDVGFVRPGAGDAAAAARRLEAAAASGTSAGSGIGQPAAPPALTTASAATAQTASPLVPSATATAGAAPPPAQVGPVAPATAAPSTTYSASPARSPGAGGR